MKTAKVEIRDMWLIGRLNKPRALRPRRERRYASDTLTTPIGDVVNLSASGVCIRGKGHPTLATGQVITVKLRSPQGELNLMGRVAWLKQQRNSFEVGMQFVGIRPAMAATLRQLAQFGFIPRVEQQAPPEPPKTRKAAPDDPYEILGVEPTATDDELQRAYRKLARVYHPDANKDAEASKRFETIVEAYRTVQQQRLRAGSGAPAIGT